MGKVYDVFNGDADGLCALLQLRLATPCESVLVTGVKRDIKLLDKVDVQRNDEIYVFDISSMRIGKRSCEFYRAAPG